MELYSKILLCVALVSLFAGKAVIDCSGRAVHGALLARIEREATGAARQSAGALAEAMASGEEGRILPLLQAYQRATGGVYTAALDGRGRVLAHSDVAEFGRVYADEETASALKSDRVLARETRTRTTPVLELNLPVFSESRRSSAEDFLFSDPRRPLKGERIGLLRVGIPLDEPLAAERRSSGCISRVMLIVGSAAGLILCLFMRCHLSRPALRFL